jgi:hypothetical protein
MIGTIAAATPWALIVLFAVLWIADEERKSR